MADKNKNKPRRSNAALNKVKDQLKKANENARVNARRLKDKLQVDGTKMFTGVAGGALGAVAVSWAKKWAVEAFPEWADKMPYIMPAAVAVIGGAVALTMKSPNVQYFGIGLAVAGVVGLATRMTDEWAGAEGAVLLDGAAGPVLLDGAGRQHLLEGALGWEEHAVPARNPNGDVAGMRKLIQARRP